MIILFIYCADMENCRRFRSFSFTYIYIYRERERERDNKCVTFCIYI